MKRASTKKHKKSTKKFTRKINHPNWSSKYIILREDDTGAHLRRPIYSYYVGKKGTMYHVKIPIETLLTINNNINIIKKKTKVQLYDTFTNKKYSLFGSLSKNGKDILMNIDEKFVAISSRWPEKLPANLPFEPRVISKFDLGEPSVWRVARYVENPKTKEIFFLKLMPKDLIRGISSEDKLDRLYKELNNQEKSKSPYVVGSISGEEGNFIWSLMEITPNGSLFELKEAFPNKRIPEFIALYILKQIVLGLMAIHKAKVFHNWLQLKTIYIDKNYNIKIGNFGESIDSRNYTEFERIYFTEKLISWPETKSKMVYPPEWVTKVEYNEKTDIWGLGIVFLKMLINEEKDKEDVSPTVKNLLGKMLHVNPAQRATLEEILNHSTLKSLTLSTSLNPATREIKLWTFSNYFLSQYQKTFFFRKKTSPEYIDKYIKEYLLSFTKSFCYDEYTGWNSILNKIWYHDQATIPYNVNSPNTIFITQFDDNSYFKIDIRDLLKPTLPEKYSTYITNEKWNTFRDSFHKLLKITNPHFNNKELNHFRYSDLEKNRERTFESLPTNMLLANSKKMKLNGKKQVLSLLIKVSKQQCGILNEQGRTTSMNEEFDGHCYYIPLELCEEDVISTLMASAYSEYTISKRRFLESYCYITIRKSTIHPSSSQGVRGWHVDGSWGEQTYRHQNLECQNGIYTSLFSDRNYIIQSSEEIKTPIAIVPLNLDPLRKEAMEKYNKGEITVLPSDLTDEVLLHKYLTHNIDYPPYQPPGLTLILDQAVEQAVAANKDAIVELPANTLNFFTAYTIHNVPPNRTNKIIQRDTLRISYSSDYFDKACGPTISPSLGIPGGLRFYPYPKPYELRKNINLINKLF